jgi:hypothetical protein
MDARSIWGVNQRDEQIIISGFPTPALAHKSRLSHHFALNFKLMSEDDEILEPQTPFPVPSA